MRTCGITRCGSLGEFKHSIVVVLGLVVRFNSVWGMPSQLRSAGAFVSVFVFNRVAICFPFVFCVGLGLILQLSGFPFLNCFILHLS